MRQIKFEFIGTMYRDFFFKKSAYVYILLGSFILSNLVVQAQPIWTSSYPTVVSGASSADITVSINETGTVFYAVYTSAQLAITAAQLKIDATGAGGGAIVKKGSIAISTINTNFKASLSNMPDNTTYYFYIVAQGSTSGLQNTTSIKSFTKVFPLRQTSNSFRSKFGPNALVGYLAYVPEAYYKNPTQNFPILLMLHGQGEKIWNPQSISQLNLVRKYGPAMLIDNGQEFPFIVITPQCPFPGWDDVTVDNYATIVTKKGAFVNEIYDQMESKYRVDHTREYLTGISMGGAGVWNYLSVTNDRLAAAIPISGWGDPTTACVTASQNVAVWAFQGANDGAGGMTNLVNAINACKPAPVTPTKLTVYAGLGHEIWDITYNNTGPGIAPDNIYDWLMRYTKTSLPANVSPVSNAGADQVITLPVSSVTLTGKGTDSDGIIASYLWTQKTGTASTLTGTTTTTLTATGLAVGTYTYTLTVTDNAGAKATDDVIITVKAAVVTPPPNVPPVSNAGLDQVITLPISSVTLVGKGTDSDGTIASYLWTQKTGAASTLTGTTTTTLTVSGLTVGTYTYTLAVTDNVGAKTTDDVVVTVKDAVIPPAKGGTGLHADYFNNKSLTGTPFLTETDTTINFNWGTSAPKSGMPIDLFSMRWTGKIVPNYSGSYTFYATSDDGINVWVNGVLVVSNWSSHSATENTGNITLVAGTQYDIKIEYYELWGPAVAKLSWSSASQPKQIIPKMNLYPTTASQRADDDAYSAALSSPLHAYPIPIKDLVNIDFSSNEAGVSEIKLVDDLSQILYQTNLPVSKGPNTTTLDISQIKSGLYILVVNSAVKTETLRVVITK